MENHVWSGWSEAVGLEQCQTELRNSDGNARFLTPPWVPTPGDNLGSFYGQFPASAAASASYPCPPWPVELLTDGGGGSGVQEDKAADVSKNHSLAEKRRRDRINAHLATLRKLIPDSSKMDKAAILEKVVENIKELKASTMELSKVSMIPTDTDEVIVDPNSYTHHESSSSSSTNTSINDVFIKASVCCDDRPELFSELSHALRSLRLSMVRADMTCLGGRIKVILFLCNEDSATKLDGIGMSKLKQSLRAVLSRVVSAASMESSNYRIKSRRQRFFFPSNQY